MFEGLLCVWHIHWHRVGAQSVSQSTALTRKFIPLFIHSFIPCLGESACRIRGCFTYIERSVPKPGSVR